MRLPDSIALKHGTPRRPDRPFRKMCKCTSGSVTTENALNVARTNTWNTTTSFRYRRVGAALNATCNSYARRVTDKKARRFSALALRYCGISKQVKTGLIITVGIVVAAFVYVYAYSTNYYSDYNRCLRFYGESPMKPDNCYALAVDPH